MNIGIAELVIIFVVLIPFLIVMGLVLGLVIKLLRQSNNPVGPHGAPPV